MKETISVAAPTRPDKATRMRLAMAGNGSFATKKRAREMKKMIPAAIMLTAPILS
jgi:hypothetical protein